MRILSVYTILLFFTAQVFSQQHYTQTLLPTREQKIFDADTAKKRDTVPGFFLKGNNSSKQPTQAYLLRYNIASIPAYADSISFTLLLHYRDKPGQPLKEEVDVYLLPRKQEQAFSDQVLGKDLQDSVSKNKYPKMAYANVITDKTKKGDAIEFTFSQKYPGKRILDSLLQINQGYLDLLVCINAKELNFFSSAEDAENPGKGFQPELVVRYFEKPHFESYNSGDAQHSGQANWHVNSSISKTTFYTNKRDLKGNDQFVNFNQGGILMHDGFLMVPVQSSAGFEIQRYATNGAFMGSTGIISTQMGQAPAITKTGKLLYYSGEGKITTMDIINGFSHARDKIYSIGTAGTIQQQPVVPAKDGSMYVSTNRGLYALSPEGKLKWKIDSVDLSTVHFSLPALNAEESKIYVLFKEADCLLTINTQDGTIINRLPALGLQGNVLPVIVYQAQANRVVFTNADLKYNPAVKENQLFIVDEAGKLVKKLGKHESFAQPVCVYKGIFILHDSHLQYFGLANNELVSVVYGRGEDDTASRINMASLLLTDSTGRLFLLDKTPDAQKLKVFRLTTEKDKTYIQQEGQSKIVEDNITNEFCLLPNGNLVTTANNSIVQIDPWWKMERTVVDRYGRFAYLQWFNYQPFTGTFIPQNSNTLVYAAGNVLGRKGFGVPKGAQFKLQDTAGMNLLVDTAGYVSAGKDTVSTAALEIASGNMGFVFPNSGGNNTKNITGLQEGMMFYHEEANKLTFFNGKKWVFTDNSPARYEVGDTLDDGIVIFVDETGIHGKLLRNVLIDSAYYIDSSAYALLSQGEKLLNNGSGKVNSGIILEKLKGFYAQDKEFTYSQRRNIYNILYSFNGNNTTSARQWYMPSSEEALLIVKVLKLIKFKPGASIWTSSMRLNAMQWMPLKENASIEAETITSKKSTVRSLLLIRDF